MPRDNLALPAVTGPQARAIPLIKIGIGKKLLVALTGLFLCSFLIVHLSGNMLLFKNDGGKAFEAYSEFMSTNPVIRTMEIVLFAGFLTHIIWAVSIWITNRMARPQSYAMNQPSANSTLASRTSFLTGSIVFIFLVVHLKSFWVPARFPSGAKPSMYEVVVTAFRNPAYDLLYLIALVLLGYHLNHGFQSAFQTFGLNPGRNKWINRVAIFFWLIIPIGFAAMPVFFYWSHLKGVR